MPKCFAVNCYTKSVGGNKLFLLPTGERNTERRKKWLKRMGRKEKETVKSTRLCEFHFRPDQFERNRQDGVIKLKPNAVPTIFPYRLPRRKRKRIAVTEPTSIESEPGLEPDTSTSSALYQSEDLLKVVPEDILRKVKVEPEEVLGHSNDDEISAVVMEEFQFQQPPENLVKIDPEDILQQVKVEPEDIFDHSNNEGNSTVGKETSIFQEVEADPIPDDCEASETPSDENLNLKASRSESHVDESSKSVTGELTDTTESDMQPVMIRKIKKKNGEIIERIVRRHLKCPYCGKAFPYPSRLRKHAVTHVEPGRKIYKCPSCIKCFAYQTELKRHLLTHNGVTPFLCKFCDKSYAEVSTLIQHAIVHTGLQKPTHINIYECACGAAFKHRYICRQHQRIHAGDEPYCCTLCTKFFSLRCELKVHMKDHS